MERLKAQLEEVQYETEVLEENLRKRDDCLERMKAFVSSLPRWMESTLY